MTYNKNDNRIYKTTGSFEKGVKYVKKEVEEIIEPIKKEIEKLMDPTVHAALMYTAVRERESTNLILANINSKIEFLEERIKKIEEKLGFHLEVKRDILLGEIDERIIELIKNMGKVCAEDVQRAFTYRGKNAASARLNKLFEQGFLEKKKAGRKTYYLIK